MKNKPLISIIIPVFQAEEFIEKTINNLEKQTYPNIEIICIDDGSTDNSYGKCVLLASKYNNVRIFKNNENKGQEYTRNFGIRNALGTYFTFVDADDTINNDMISSLYFYAASNNSDIVFSGYKEIRNEICIDHLAKIPTGFYSPEILVKYLFTDFPLDVFSCIGGKLYNTDFIIKNSICFDRLDKRTKQRSKKDP